MRDERIYWERNGFRATVHFNLAGGDEDRRTNFNWAGRMAGSYLKHVPSQRWAREAREYGLDGLEFLT